MAAQVTEKTAAAPGWVEELRKGAWQDFLSAPFPKSTSEVWRRTDFKSWNLDQLADGGRPAADVKEDSAVRGLTPAERPEEGDLGGLFSQKDAGSSFSMVCADLSPKGVVVSSLEEAAGRFPELVRPYLQEFWAVEDFRKMELANRSLWRGGSFVYVPDGVRAVLPLRLLIRQEKSRAHFPRSLVVAGARSELYVIEEHSSDSGGSGDGVSSSFSRLILKEGAVAHFFYTQEMGAKNTHFWHQRCTLEKDAQLFHTSVVLGGSVHKTNLEVELAGPGARSELFGIILGGAHQHFDTHTHQIHRKDHTYSDLLFKAALREDSRSVYTGLIHIEKKASETNAYQANHNLLLSPQARADSTPVLEILTDSVHCKHGATVGTLNPEELFYLQTRGFSPREAERTLVLGFFEPVLDKFPLDSLKERLLRKIESNLEQGAVPEELGSSGTEA